MKMLVVLFLIAIAGLSALIIRWRVRPRPLRSKVIPLKIRRAPTIEELESVLLQYGPLGYEALQRVLINLGYGPGRPGEIRSMLMQLMSKHQSIVTIDGGGGLEFHSIATAGVDCIDY